MRSARDSGSVVSVTHCLLYMPHISVRVQNDPKSIVWSEGLTHRPPFPANPISPHHPLIQLVNSPYLVEGLRKPRLMYPVSLNRVPLKTGLRRYLSGFLEVTFPRLHGKAVRL
jgi:hypothetical protein